MHRVSEIVFQYLDIELKYSFASLVPKPHSTAFSAIVEEDVACFFFCNGCKKSYEGRPGYEATHLLNIQKRSYSSERKPKVGYMCGMGVSDVPSFFREGSCQLLILKPL